MGIQGGKSMSDVRIELEGPSHEEIEQRAYELYLRGREGVSAQEYWLRAEDELRQNHDKQREPITLKSKTVAASAGSAARNDKNR
jgi:DUF2934 family protein